MSQPASCAESPAGDKAPSRDDLGVLFVHGIGMQQRGEILAECGGALYRWLERWLPSSAARRLRPCLLETYLAEDLDRTGSPARARLVFNDEPGPDAEPAASWLLAESHWAQSFRAASYGQLLAWALVTVPRAVCLHAINPAQSLRTALEDAAPGERRGHVDVDRGIRLTGGETARRTLGGATAVLAAPVLIAAILLALALLFLLGLVPIAASRTAALNLQRRLAGTLGDSFLFTSSPLTEAAVITSVQDDLQWLARRCRKVVIVAHSQGAAVSYRMLQRLREEAALPANLAGLITYGSGLRKLADLTRSREPQPGIPLFGWIGTALSLGLLFTLGSLIAVPSLWSAVVAPLLFLVMTLLVTFGTVAIARPGREPVLPVAWSDFYSSRDPVPNGPVDARFWAAAAATGKGWQSVGDRRYDRRSTLVFNQHSIVFDHTTYWASSDDFTGRVAAELGRLGGLTLVSKDEFPRLQAAAGARRRRAWQLAGFRTAAVLAALTTLKWHNEAVAHLGHLVGGWLPAPEGDGWLASGFEWLVSQPVLLGIAGLALILAALYKLGRAAWCAWQQRETRSLFAQAAHGPLAPGLVLFVGLWLGLVALPAVVAARLTPGCFSLGPIVVGLLWAALRLFPGPRIWDGANPSVAPPG